MSAVFTQARDFWRECRDGFGVYMEAEHEKAAEACRDHLLNRAAREAGISSMSLFIGRHDRAARYASEELLEYWQYNPRITYRDYEAQMVRSLGWGA